MKDLLQEMAEAAARVELEQTWYLTAPLEDHDGGDEDDQLVKMRAFLRAARHPRARVFVEGERAYVMHMPEDRMPPLLVPRFEIDSTDDASRWTTFTYGARK